jgi:hypothetical protein
MSTTQKQEDVMIIEDADEYEALMIQQGRGSQKRLTGYNVYCIVYMHKNVKTNKNTGIWARPFPPQGAWQALSEDERTRFNMISKNFPSLRFFNRTKIWVSMRAQILQICMALQPLEISAHELLSIVDQSCEFADSFPLHLKWNVITAIKHFH